MLKVKTPEEVYEIIKTQFKQVPDRTETVPYTEAAGRVLAEDIWMCHMPQHYRI